MFQYYLVTNLNQLRIRIPELKNWTVQVATGPNTNGDATVLVVLTGQNSLSGFALWFTEQGGNAAVTCMGGGPDNKACAQVLPCPRSEWNIPTTGIIAPSCSL